MTAPVATTRGTPAGIPLDDGFSCKITFALDSDISFWEKTVQPPGIDGGDAIEFTSMHNVTWRTFAARQLKTLTSGKTSVMYDPAVYDQILAIVNQATTITITFPDGSTYAFYGYLQKFEPSELQEGENPMADVTFQPTNWDPTAHVEAGPTLVSVAGT